MSNVRTWGRINAAPNEFLIHLRRGRVVRSGAGLSIFAWPGDSWAVVPTSIQRVAFSADQVTAERVGVEIRGVAQSSTRVSALMRQIDSSNWLDDPEVERVETKQSGSSRQSEFVVYLKQKREGTEEDTE